MMEEAGQETPLHFRCDKQDNRFYDQNPRFPQIEEDEPPLYLLCTDYPKHYPWVATG